MKKGLLAVSMMVALALVPVSAQAVCDCANCQKGTISVFATSQKEIAPDTVEISIAVTTYDKVMQRATTQNKETSEKIYSALKSMINTQNGDTIKTANYSATAQYTYSNNKRNFDKYQVSNKIVLKTKSIDKIGVIIDKATSLGATSVDNLNFSASNYDLQYDDLISSATKKAKNQANVMAKAATATLDGVKSLSVNCNNIETNRVYYTMAKMSSAVSADGVEATPSPIEAGTIKLKATVNASFYVK